MLYHICGTHRAHHLTGAELACIDGGFAQCVNGKWQVQKCTSDLRCYALPLSAKTGTSIACDKQDQALARFEAAGVSGGSTGFDSGAGGSSTQVEEEDEDIEDCEEAFFEVPAEFKAKEQHNHRRQVQTVTVLPSLPASTLASLPNTVLGLPTTSTIVALPTATLEGPGTVDLPVGTPTLPPSAPTVVTVIQVSTVTITATGTDTDCSVPLPTGTSLPGTILNPPPAGSTTTVTGTLDSSSSASSLPPVTPTVATPLPPTISPTSPLPSTTPSSGAPAAGTTTAALPVITLSPAPASQSTASTSTGKGIEFTFGTLFTPASVAPRATDI